MNYLQVLSPISDLLNKNDNNICVAAAEPYVFHIHCTTTMRIGWQWNNLIMTFTSFFCRPLQLIWWQRGHTYTDTDAHCTAHIYLLYKLKWFPKWHTLSMRTCAVARFHIARMELAKKCCCKLRFYIYLTYYLCAFAFGRGINLHFQHHLPIDRPFVFNVVVLLPSALAPWSVFWNCFGASSSQTCIDLQLRSIWICVRPNYNKSFNACEWNRYPMVECTWQWTDGRHRMNGDLIKCCGWEINTFAHAVGHLLCSCLFNIFWL